MARLVQRHLSTHLVRSANTWTAWRRFPWSFFPPALRLRGKQPCCGSACCRGTGPLCHNRPRHQLLEDRCDGVTGLHRQGDIQRAKIHESQLSPASLRSVYRRERHGNSKPDRSSAALHLETKNLSCADLEVSGHPQRKCRAPAKAELMVVISLVPNACPLTPDSGYGRIGAILPPGT